LTEPAKWCTMTTLWGHLPSWSGWLAPSHVGRCRPFCLVVLLLSPPMPFPANPETYGVLRIPCSCRSTNVTVNAVDLVSLSGLIILFGPNRPYFDQTLWPITTVWKSGLAQRGEACYNADGFCKKVGRRQNSRWCVYRDGGGFAAASITGRSTGAIVRLWREYGRIANPTYCTS